MSSEDKFKDLLNERLSEKDFSFTAENWEKAQQLIDRSRAKKKRRGIFLIWGVLFMGISIMWLYLSNQTQAPVNLHQASVFRNTELLKSMRSLKQKNDLASAERKPQRSVRSVHQAAPGSTREDRIQKPSDDTPEKPKGILKDRSENIRRGSPEIMNSPGKMAHAAVSTSLPEILPLPLKTEDKILSLPTGTTDEHEQAPQPEISSLAPDLLLEAAPATAAPEPTLAVSPLLADTAATVLAVPSETTSVKDSAVTVAAAEERLKPLYPKNFFYIEAGSTLLAGWKDREKRDGAGFNPLLGIGYLSCVTAKLGFSFGLQYTFVGNLKTYSHSSKVSTLGLGEESVVTVITPSRIHYIGIPVRFNLTLDPKNIIGIGYTLGYLLSVDSKMEIYDQRANLSTSEHSSSSVKGYTQGFSTFDSQLSLFYRRRLLKNLLLNTEFLFGLTDVKKNNFFGSDAVQRNYGLKLSLMYNLFKK